MRPRATRFLLAFATLALVVFGLPFTRQVVKPNIPAPGVAVVANMLELSGLVKAAIPK